MSERRRWMLFVDGENFAIRGQKLAAARGLPLPEGPYYRPNTFLWFPVFTARQRPRFLDGEPHFLLDVAERAFYYAAAQGDNDELGAVKEALWGLGFFPQVFQKRKVKPTKRVDITLATDMLSNAYLGNYDVAVLVAGDEDYIPLVAEAQRLGRVVTIGFFADPTAGLSPNLKLRADGFVPLDEHFLKSWHEFLATNELRHL